MTNTNLRRSDQPPLKGFAASGVVDAIAKRDPKTPLRKVKLAGRAAAALAGVAVQLTSEQQTVLLNNLERLAQMLVDAVRGI